MQKALKNLLNTNNGVHNTIQTPFFEMLVRLRTHFLFCRKGKSRWPAHTHTHIFVFARLLFFCSRLSFFCCDCFVFCAVPWLSLSLSLLLFFSLCWCFGIEVRVYSVYAFSSSVAHSSSFLPLPFFSCVCRRIRPWLCPQNKPKAIFFFAFVSLFPFPHQR